MEEKERRAIRFRFCGYIVGAIVFLIYVFINKNSILAALGF